MDLQARFESNLILAQDENPDASFQEQVRLAREWTTDEVIGEVNRIAEHRHSGYQEAVNWHSYEEREVPPSFVELMSQDNHFLGA